MAWTDKDGKVWYVKNGVTADEFLDDHLDELDADATTVILHTRWATKGSPTIETNNHPIVRPGIVGVHNGVISNDDEIFDLLATERLGEVDSEAAFALIAESNMHPTDSLTLLDGTMAFAWIDTDNGHTLHVARRSGRPLAIGQTRNGTFVFASTLPMLVTAGREAGLSFSMTQNVPDGWYFRVRQGIVHDTLPIGVPSSLDAALMMMGGK
jgi:glucosamine 6-phosphate synthetase-like amidotransferase/phosphosugar isomerase protein